MKRRVIICGIIAVILLLSGCGSKKSASYSGSNAAPQANGNSSSTQDGKFSMQNSATLDKAKGTSTTEANNTTQKLDSTAQNTGQEKKIIRFCTLMIQENDLSKLSASIQSKANELGGYIESENIMQESLNTVVRIPSDKFEGFISFAEKGFAVKSKNIATDNITDAYVDNDARLKNLLAQEDQVLTILKKANTVDEVLKVQSELYRIRGEAEALEARKKSWDKQVGYATITINASKNVIVPDSKKTIISGSEFFKAIGKGFSNTSVALILFIENILIFIISNIIVLAILGAAGFFGYKWYKKNNKMNL